MNKPETFGFLGLMIMQALTIYALALISARLDRILQTIEMLHRQATIMIQQNSQNQKGH